MTSEVQFRNSQLSCYLEIKIIHHFKSIKEKAMSSKALDEVQHLFIKNNNNKTQKNNKNKNTEKQEGNSLIRKTAFSQSMKPVSYNAIMAKYQKLFPQGLSLRQGCPLFLMMPVILNIFNIVFFTLPNVIFQEIKVTRLEKKK